MYPLSAGLNSTLVVLILATLAASVVIPVLTLKVVCKQPLSRPGSDVFTLLIHTHPSKFVLEGSASSKLKLVNPSVSNLPVNNDSPPRYMVSHPTFECVLS